LTTPVADANLPFLLLVSTTRTLRLVLPVLVFLAWTPVAHAWSWPVRGPVLQPFLYDEAHPYAAGQHRGIDIGAASAGESVVAPAAGTVSFAGTVPASGTSVTIETSDGHSVTLTHLGSIRVSKGAAVAEGDAVGAVGPSGTPEVDGPYVHLGIRLTADQNGYLDPLSLLPATMTQSPPAENDPTASQPSTGAGATAAAPAPPAAPAAQPAPAPAASASSPPASVSPQPSTRGKTIQRRPHVLHRARGLVQEPRAETRPQRSLRRPARHPAARTASRAHHRVGRPDQHLTEPTSSPGLPVVEAAVPREPTDLPAGHDVRPSVHRAPTPRAQPHGRASGALLPLFCNGAAALIAVGAALAAARRRRRYVYRSSLAGAQILRLPQEAVDPPRRKAA
jgi:peptidase M23-like protein